jgi:hypothetical protein
MNNKMKVQNTEQTKRKSVKLTKDECKQLKSFRKGFSTDGECADALGIERVTLLRVLLAGSGSEKTIGTIKAKLLEVTV